MAEAGLGADAARVDDAETRGEVSPGAAVAAAPGLDLRSLPGTFHTETGPADGIYSLSADITFNGTGNCFLLSRNCGGGPERVTSF
jgi:hypothetical protein